MESKREGSGHLGSSHLVREMETEDDHLDCGDGHGESLVCDQINQSMKSMIYRVSWWMEQIVNFVMMIRILMIQRAFSWWNRRYSDHR